MGLGVKHLIAAIFVLAIFFSMGSAGTVSQPAGILAPSQPRQTNIENPQRWKVDDFLVTPLAEYSLQGLVVRSKRYYFGEDSKLSPVDLVLAWGPASDVSELEKIKFRQGGRFYRWSTRDLSVDVKTISRNTANVHILPANDNIAAKIKSLKVNQLVQLNGYLVRADRPDGWNWVSSLTRTDTGAGACELFWVESVW